MPATPGAVPEGPGWAYEFKWDGGPGHRRCQRRRGAALQPQQQVAHGELPELSELRHLISEPVLRDGEIVALDAPGRPDFGLLHSRTHRHAPS